MELGTLGLQRRGEKKEKEKKKRRKNGVKEEEEQKGKTKRARTFSQTISVDVILHIIDYEHMIASHLNHQMQALCHAAARKIAFVEHFSASTPP